MHSEELTPDHREALFKEVQALHNSGSTGFDSFDVRRLPDFGSIVSPLSTVLDEDLRSFVLKEMPLEIAESRLPDGFFNELYIDPSRYNINYTVIASFLRKEPLGRRPQISVSPDTRPQLSLPDRIRLALGVVRGMIENPVRRID